MCLHMYAGERRMARWGRLASVLSALAFVCTPGTAPQAADALSTKQLDEIRALSAAALTRDRIPGLSVAVGKGNEVRSFGFGHANLEHSVPVESLSPFRTASISKWLTATAALRLVDEGKLDLDAPVQKYCPQYPEQSWTITARQLLSHLAGVRHYHGQNGEKPTTDAQRKVLEELIATEQRGQSMRYIDVIKPLEGFKNDPLLSQPGTRQRYTSLGYTVLACALEGAAQMPYRTLMHDLVFAPAGMTSTRDDDALAIVPHRVEGYARNANGTLVKARFRDISSNVAGGGHLATAEDLVRFALAFNSGRLVQTATRDRMMMRPRLIDGAGAPDLPPAFGLGAAAYYGMGIMVSSVDGETVVLHPGSQAGASTELLLAPESGIAIAVMSNFTGWGGMHALAAEILAVAENRRREP
jgi:serine beta-lactamase-like protein LACTB